MAKLHEICQKDKRKTDKNRHLKSQKMPLSELIGYQPVSKEHKNGLTKLITLLNKVNKIVEQSY